MVLTGNRRVNISGFGGNIRRADLTDLHQQSCHVVIEWREGLTEGHQAWKDGHKERVPLGPGQHWEQIDHLFIAPKTHVAATQTTSTWMHDRGGERSTRLWGGSPWRWWLTWPHWEIWVRRTEYTTGTAAESQKSVWIFTHALERGQQMDGSGKGPWARARLRGFTCFSSWGWANSSGMKSRQIWMEGMPATVRGSRAWG